MPLCWKSQHCPLAGTYRILVLTLALAAASHASSIYFATGPTTISPAGSSPVQVNAQVNITFDATAHTMTIQLLDLQINPTSIPQILSGVEMDLSNLGAGNLTGSINSFAGTQFSIDGAGAITSVTSATTSSWLVGTANGNPTAGYDSNTLSLCEICKFGGPGPAQLVIGGPSTPTGPYSTKGGLTTTPHQPYILGSGQTYTSGPFSGKSSTPTWVLNVPNIIAATTVSDVRFFFGSAYDSTQEVIVLPEPGPVAMMAGGLMLIVIGAWKRRKPRS